MAGVRLHLVIIDQKRSTRGEISFEPSGGTVVIGRDPESRVLLSSQSVSRKHATIEPAPDGWVITDQSSLGTSLNGRPLRADEAELLRDGDTLSLPGFELRVRLVKGESAPSSDKSLGPEQLVQEAGTELPSARLLVHQGDQEPKEIELPEEGSSLLIGRSSECDIQVDDPLRLISALHAKIERDWAGTFVYDLSRNGVFVNGTRVEDCAPLKGGDRITLVVAEEREDAPVLVYVEASTEGAKPPTALVERSAPAEPEEKTAEPQEPPPPPPPTAPSSRPEEPPGTGEENTVKERAAEGESRSARPGPFFWIVAAVAVLAVAAFVLAGALIFRRG